MKNGNIGVWTLFYMVCFLTGCILGCIFSKYPYGVPVEFHDDLDGITYYSATGKKIDFSDEKLNSGGLEVKNHCISGYFVMEIRTSDGSNARDFVQLVEGENIGSPLKCKVDKK